MEQKTHFVMFNVLLALKCWSNRTNRQTKLKQSNEKQESLASTSQKATNDGNYS